MFKMHLPSTTHLVCAHFYLVLGFLLKWTIFLDKCNRKLPKSTQDDCVSIFSLLLGNTHSRKVCQNILSNKTYFFLCKWKLFFYAGNMCIYFMYTYPRIDFFLDSYRILWQFSCNLFTITMMTMWLALGWWRKKCCIFSFLFYYYCCYDRS